MFDIASMAFPLPEDIQLRKAAGDFDAALRLIDIYLAENRAPLLGDRLNLEKAIIARLPANYPYTRLQALSIAQAAIPDLTIAEFDECEARAEIAYIVIDGHKRYFDSFLTSLYKMRPDIATRAGKKPPAAKPLLDETIAQIKQHGSLKYRMHMFASLFIDEKAFVPDTYYVHMPLPALSAQQSDIEIIDTSDGLADVQPEDSCARTAYFERKLDTNEPFTVEYAYTSEVKYFSTDMPAPAAPLYPAAGEPAAADLAELPGHIVFTPYLRALAADICADETDPLKKARRIYDYVTVHIKYSFMREYFLIPNIAEFAAVGLKGDCGVQALLFITLCRISGIPARWQSGLYAEPGEAGCHDWAQFYAPGWGWLFADCSFGGSAYRAGNMTRHDFYFGNLDPFRMVANSQYQAPLVPEKDFLRNDPYDNQTGECETDARPLLRSELITAQRVVSAKLMPR